VLALEDVPPGTYRIEVGVYDAATGVRLKLSKVRTAFSFRRFKCRNQAIEIAARHSEAGPSSARTLATEVRLRHGLPRLESPERLTVSRIRYTVCTIEATLRDAAQDCFVLSFIQRMFRMDLDKIVLVLPKRDGLIYGRAHGSPYTLMRLASLVPPEILLKSGRRFASD